MKTYLQVPLYPLYDSVHLQQEGPLVEFEASLAGFVVL